MGARLAGMRPNRGLFNSSVHSPGMNAVQVLQSAAKTGWDCLYVAGANPALKFPSRLWNDALSKLNFLIVQDLFLTETAKQANVVLPTLTFIEKGGSFINIEGRVQSMLPGKEVPENLYSDADIFMEIGKRLGMNMTLDPSFENRLKPGNILLEKPKKIESNATPKMPPATRKEGSLAATFSRQLFDHGVRMLHDPHLIQLVKEPYLRLNHKEGAKRNIKDGDKVRLASNGQSFSAKVKIDDGVADGTIVIPLGFEKEIPARELGPSFMNGLEVEISFEKASPIQLQEGSR